MNRALLIFAALNGALAVAAGAFAAHGAGPAVKTLLTTGAHYQLAHAVLASACAMWAAGGTLGRLAGWLAAVGGLVFALSLYAVGLIGLGAAGAIAPVGGLLMIGGWLTLAAAGWRLRSIKA